jgi:hypothetical protein
MSERERMNECMYVCMKHLPNSNCRRFLFFRTKQSKRGKKRSKSIIIVFFFLRSIPKQFNKIDRRDDSYTSIEQ